MACQMRVISNDVALLIVAFSEHFQSGPFGQEIRKTF